MTERGLDEYRGTAAAKVWRRGSTKAASKPTGLDGE